MLTRHYHILMQVAGLASEGKDQKQMAAVCKIPPFSVKKYQMQAAKYSFEDLKTKVTQCQETDQGIKTGKITDIVGVELLIVSFSG